jgi:hypothetical protein
MGPENMKLLLVHMPEEWYEEFANDFNNAALEWSEIDSQEALFKAFGYEPEDRAPDLHLYNSWSAEARHIKNYNYPKDQEERGKRKLLGLITLAAIDVAHTLAGYYGKRE